MVRAGAVGAARGGVGVPGASEEAEHEVVERGQDLGRVAPAGLAVVLAERGVAAVVRPVLDRPVTACAAEQAGVSRCSAAPESSNAPTVTICGPLPGSRAALRRLALQASRVLPMPAGP